MFRSGGAPPTVQGARTAIGALLSAAPAHVDSLGGGNRSVVGGSGDILSEDEIRSHPAYLSYYYSNEHLNPRLPPPMVSKEDWRAAQRFQAVSEGIGDRRRRPSEEGSGSSLFSMQPGACEGSGEELLMNDRLGRGERNGLARQQSSKWLRRGTDALIGLSNVGGLGSRRKSFADALQENIGRPAASSGHLSRSNSRNAFESSNSIRSTGSSKARLQGRSESMNGLRSGSTSPSLVRVQSLGFSISNSFASAVGSSLSRSITPDPQLIRRTPSPCLPPVGVRMRSTDKKVEGASVASHNHDGADISAALSAMSNLSLSGNKMADLETEVQNHLYQNFGDKPDVLFNVPKERRQFSQQKLAQNEDSINALEYAAFSNGSSNFNSSSMNKLAADNKSKFPIQSPHGNAHKKGSLLSPTGFASLYQNLNGDSSNIDVFGRHSKTHAGGFGAPMLNNQLNADVEYINHLSNQGGFSFQGQPMEAMYVSYLQANSDSLLGTTTNMSPFQGSSFSGSGHLDSPGFQKAYLGSLLAQQKLQYGMPYLGKSGGLNPSLYGSDSAFGMGMTYLSSPTSSPFISSSQGHVRQGDRLTRIPPMVRSTNGGSWNSDNGLMDNGYGSSLLEEFKTNKTRSFELLDIVGHVVEFRSDQYRSRFIQRKLETAFAEEKTLLQNWASQAGYYKRLGANRFWPSHQKRFVSNGRERVSRAMHAGNDLKITTFVLFESCKTLLVLIIISCIVKLIYIYTFNL